MTRYEYLTTRANDALERAKSARENGAYELATFYYNAFIGYNKRAASLTIEEAGEEVTPSKEVTYN